MPSPKAMCGSGSRVISNWSAFLKTVAHRDRRRQYHQHGTAFGNALPVEFHLLQHIARAICCTGLVKRNISSSAPSNRAGFAFSCANCSGYSSSASVPLPMRLTVVSWPASNSNKQHGDQLILQYESPCSSACTSARIKSSAGSRRRSAIKRLEGRDGKTVGNCCSVFHSDPPSKKLCDHVMKSVPRPATGTPIISEMTVSGSGRAKSAIRSTVLLPAI